MNNMRRPGSSSCLLLPKGSSNDGGGAGDSSSPQEGSQVPSHESSTFPLSVTILSKDKLPSYSCERFYMLSELDQKAQPNVWLGDKSHDHDNSTQTTEETDDDPDDANDPDRADVHHAFPPFVLLYTFWRHEDDNTTDGPEDFVETILLEAVRQIQNQNGIQLVNSLQEEQQLDRRLLRRASSGASSFSIGGGSFEEEKAKLSTTSTTAQKCCLYLIVDRLMDHNNPPDQNRLEQEEDRAERLARAVAAHPVLRHCTEGITIGLSNHPRAAPALEACVDAVTIGATERRRYCSSSGAGSDVSATKALSALDPERALLGIVATGPDQLLGQQDASVTDAAQGVQQIKITAEWNGNGNLTCFAQRAHREWCRRNGCSENSTSDAADRRHTRKLPRRLPRALRMPHRAQGRRRGNNQMVPADVLAIAWFLVYVLFHFYRHETIQLVHQCVSAVVSNIVQFR